MGKFKFILISIVPFLVVGCTALNESGKQILQSGLSANETPAAQANNKVTKSQGNLKGWEFTVTSVKSEGQIIKADYMTYEAAEAWTVVSVAVKNISGKRQPQDKVGANLMFSKLIDSKGNKYELPELKFNSSTDLYSKPFSVGETRSFDLLFDAPQGIKTKQLSIGFGMSEGDSIHIKL